MSEIAECHDCPWVAVGGDALAEAMAHTKSTGHAAQAAGVDISTPPLEA